MNHLGRVFHTFALVAGLGMGATHLLAGPGENIAPGKPASMSSTYTGDNRRGVNPAGGNDGVISGIYGFHTFVEDHPWWQVDLQKVYDIQSMKIFNRGDGYQDRADSLQVLVSTDNRNWTPYYTHDAAKSGHIGGKENPLEITELTRARWVKIQLLQRNYLHLDEVEIYEKVDPAKLMQQGMPGMPGMPGISGMPNL